ncbi:MAG: hypothetical protein H6822_16940 [Planctomycetaceae bacterium]|nr:hypothetical protein [Planctomycetales bacterium]MCB9923871.1 hypothetical protein [Planctomycetaceae bacterium]
MPRPARSSSEVALALPDLALLVVALVCFVGCATVSQEARHSPAQPDFRNPLAMRAGDTTTEPNQLVAFSDEAVRLIDDSLVNLMRGDRIIAWDTWARDNLQDGDIVFLQSRSNWVWGVIELSQLTRDVTDSDFTHVALAAVEEGEVFLYDIDTPGPGRTRFGAMMADSQTAAVAVKRLRPEFQPYVPDAIQYCRDVYNSRLPFDKQLKLDNDRLYCAELIEVAFRSAGLELSQPTRWESLPGLDKHPLAVRTIAWANSTQPEEFVVVPGNEKIGIWASPGLYLVLPLTDAKVPPAASASSEP